MPTVSSEHPLHGRTALVTGVSRRRGIAFAVASRLARMGASLALTSHAAHDAAQPWGADDPAAVTAELREQLVPGARLAEVPADLADPDAPDRVVAALAAELGHLDALVCVHARSGGDAALPQQTPEMLDGHWQVNARSTLLLTKAFAAQPGFDGWRPGQQPPGRVVWLSSGQHLGPMRDEVAYVASKGALLGALRTVADHLIERGIVVNAVNPGPVNTGYLDVATTDRDPAVLEQVLAAFPGGRFGEPDDPARLIAWLVSDDGRWVVGQVIDSEGGFRRWA
ncbi:SDR family oxidoreductase [Auraticoccus sp. F435]|uniref:SDR family oxidoreductase n=1 Tax=Auraticoccus cholistanensis TaxID=2656650 RepID=A0A6A9UX34_9ACTN|nr:SDR family oxidoreductase [Auraticoccus cholistanensis]MVA76215.1 SDR family oxidoreductase [Auraticoccus cholistanensis]